MCPRGAGRTELSVCECQAPPKPIPVRVRDKAFVLKAAAYDRRRDPQALSIRLYVVERQLGENRFRPDQMTKAAPTRPARRELVEQELVERLKGKASLFACT